MNFVEALRFPGRRKAYTVNHQTNDCTESKDATGKIDFNDYELYDDFKL